MPAGSRVSPKSDSLAIVPVAGWVAARIVHTLYVSTDTLEPAETSSGNGRASPSRSMGNWPVRPTTCAVRWCYDLNVISPEGGRFPRKPPPQRAFCTIGATRSSGGRTAPPPHLLLHPGLFFFFGLEKEGGRGQYRRCPPPKAGLASLPCWTPEEIKKLCICSQKAHSLAP